MRETEDSSLYITIIVPAYNEERNIRKLLIDLLRQDIHRHKNIVLRRIFVVSCSTDKTNQIVEEIARKYPVIKLIKEEKRRGKAHAINLVMRMKIVSRDDVVILVSADTRLFSYSLGKLIEPLIKDQKTGLAIGSAIVYPINDRKMNFINRFLWELLNQTNKYLSSKGELAHCFGELYAFRAALFKPIPEDIINEDQYIAATIKRSGHKVVYAENAKAILRGPLTLCELLIQRGRVNRGHLVAITKYRIRPTIFSFLLFTRPLDATKIFIHTLRKFTLSDWAYTPIFIVSELLSYFLQLLKNKGFSNLWEPILSTKLEIRGDMKS